MDAYHELRAAAMRDYEKLMNDSGSYNASSVDINAKNKRAEAMKDTIVRPTQT